jgi:hypothetical protein
VPELGYSLSSEEHKWPAPDERLELLEEAVEVIRLLWQGGYQTHRGKHYSARASASASSRRWWIRSDSCSARHQRRVTTSAASGSAKTSTR